MENQNSVAFVARVKEIKPIEGADRIESVTVEGWNSISSKGQHKVGDLVVCLTTDAVLPEQFAKDNNVETYLRKGSRVRTVKLKGVYSECILLSGILGDFKFKEGDDVEKLLGIYKYEPPVVEISLPSGKKIKKSVNPRFYVYHKFPNAKNVPNMFNEEDYVVITRKIHGSNFRASIVKKSKLSLVGRIKKFFGDKRVGYEFCYGSRTVQKFNNKKETGFYRKDYWKEVVDKYNLKERLWNFVEEYGFKDIGEGVIIYGEVYGEGVQGDKYTYGVKGRDVQLFDMQINGEYVGEEKRAYFDHIGCPSVKVLEEGFYSKELVNKHVNNQFIEGTKIPHEGVVVSSLSGDRSKISKFINPDYLVYAEKHEVPDSH